ncbi:3-isopropylmalate dehydrogenase [Enterococcus saigonensis]|uniref:3-isopropylmalate dehydrogenase n=1 Tax=Enterococcus saigonensis TaxID=1805431 RepID=A0A679IK45_9ENTE|nr:3-isopropylmalate dehydrogenase [Enterococcus saigonensis]BCA86522.1 3-isopropylmalate dehydrogenase [Enterococcus saigonensis]
MKKITVLAGDGIGPEIMNSAIAVLQAAAPKYEQEFQFDSQPFGGAGIEDSGKGLPSKTLASCQNADAILLGAIGGGVNSSWEKAEQTPEQGLLALRKALNLFANIRPISVPDALLALSPIKKEIVKGTDFIVVRELTSGIYFGKPRELQKTAAFDTCYYTETEITRIAHQAFQIAQNRNKKVTSVDKANVLATSKLWRKVVTAVSKEYPDCTLEHQLVDSCAMRIVQQPTTFDVIVTENLFGDILSDEASVLPGTLGVLPSASHSEKGVSLYEPIHGSAPDIAGQNIANPASMILSAALMLRQSFNEEKMAQAIEAAVFAVINEGIVTADLGGNAKTTEFTAAVINKIKA